MPSVDCGQSSSRCRTPFGGERGRSVARCEANEDESTSQNEYRVPIIENRCRYNEKKKARTARLTSDLVSRRYIEKKKIEIYTKNLRI